MSKPFFYFLVRGYRNYSYFNRCISSLFSQVGHPFKIIYIDDYSGLSSKEKKAITSALKDHIVILNKQRLFSLRNAYDAIHAYVDHPNAIIVNVDGDDWLSRKDVLKVIFNTYKEEKCDLTYGSCELYIPSRPKQHGQILSSLNEHIGKRYSIKVEAKNSYRKQPFQPIHLRTWKAELFKKVEKNSFLRPDGRWINFCEDQAIFFPMLEMSNGNYSVINETLYVYNRETELNDDKANIAEKLFDEVIIRRKGAKYLSD